MKFERNRVKESSTKNFVVVESPPGAAARTAAGQGPRLPVLQFGKVTQDVYVLDFKRPFAPLNAFAVALSAFAFRV
eukprot:CAMPEP_0172592864 /NCGR_PEP_ID=MMETSP1068-20121228/11995_1 /TAXON_ID=35684 /ORGANISM="Pseudopedinella elastica, Strain CCMP716" /LENGTH=75 /DNA_ID=CAMNT_0013390107 /DNA_START=1 /DNA_END=228 /DNA_ORIENTATION=-